MSSLSYRTKDSYGGSGGAKPNKLCEKISPENEPNKPA